MAGPVAAWPRNPGGSAPWAGAGCRTGGVLAHLGGLKRSRVVGLGAVAQISQVPGLGGSLGIAGGLETLPAGAPDPLTRPTALSLSQPAGQQGSAPAQAMGRPVGRGVHAVGEKGMRGQGGVPAAALVAQHAGAVVVQHPVAAVAVGLPVPGHRSLFQWGRAASASPVAAQTRALGPRRTFTTVLAHHDSPDRSPESGLVRSSPPRRCHPLEGGVDPRGGGEHTAPGAITGRATDLSHRPPTSPANQCGPPRARCPGAVRRRDHRGGQQDSERS